MDRTLARGVRAAMVSLACLAFDAAALPTVPPPCELCTSTIVAFESTRDGNNEIYVAAPDGTNQRRLTSNPALDEALVRQAALQAWLRQAAGGVPRPEALRTLAAALDGGPAP